MYEKGKSLMEPVYYQQGRGTGNNCNMGRPDMSNSNMNSACNNNSDMNRRTPNHDFNVDSGKFPIGMGYVPMQTWGNLYPLEQGLREGTIFMELNQIFCGKRGNRA